MALQNLIDVGTSRKKVGISEERIRAILPVARQYVAFWREYPDMFIDYLQTGNDPNKERKLKFYFYQRVFLRAAIRHKYVYMVFPRAYIECAKSEILFPWTNFFNCGNPIFNNNVGNLQVNLFNKGVFKYETNRRL